MVDLHDQHQETKKKEQIYVKLKIIGLGLGLQDNHGKITKSI